MNYVDCVTFFIDSIDIQLSIERTNFKKYFSQIPKKINLITYLIFNNITTGYFSNCTGFHEIKWLCVFTKINYTKIYSKSHNLGQ